MAFFDSFTDSIKQKWLQFFQANREWITLQMTIESVYTPDGGKRPSSYLILGVVNALEPKLAQLMFPFAKLNPDADTLIEVLDLHFDPDIALGNRLSPTTDPETYLRPPVVEAVPQVQEQSLPVQTSAVHQVVAEEPASNDDFSNMSLAQEDITDDSKGISQVCFNATSLTDDGDKGRFNSLSSGDDDALTGLNPSEDNPLDDVVSDIWGDETSLLNGEENIEELPSEVFNESEMARLFPNN